MRQRKPREDTAWHLDRKVPIALILAILIQTGGIVWWGATTSERLNALERKADLVAPQGDRLTRVETRLEAVQDGISEIKSILRKEPEPSARRPRS